MPRLLADWLESYLDYTCNQESPEKLHLWTGFCVLSGAIRRRIFLSRGYYKLYPNIYVLIVAESARIRKSTAMSIGMKLLRDSIKDVWYMSDSMTPEGLVKVLNRLPTVTPNENDPAHPFISPIRSDVMIHADELASLFGYDKMRASRMAILLTRMYESGDEYAHTTKGDSKIVLRNLYPTLLAGTDPRNLKVLPEEAVGGLIGRIIFVTAREKRKSIAWPEVSNQHQDLLQKLKMDLQHIGNLKGEYHPTKEARQLFDEWYTAQSKMKVGDPRLDAFHARCHDTALKLAMLLSISRSDSFSLEREHMVGGIAFIEKQLPEFSRVAQWAGSSVYSQNRAKLIDLVKRSGGATTRRFALKSMGLPSDEFDQLTVTMLQEGTLLEPRLIGKELIFRLNPEEWGKDELTKGEP